MSKRRRDSSDRRTHGQKTRDGMDNRLDEDIPVREPTVGERLAIGWLMGDLSHDDFVDETEEDL
jgi:hypothetical protein